MNKQFDLEKLIKVALVTVKPAERNLIESYFRNPNSLQGNQKDYAESILLSKYPSLFKKTQKSNLKKKIMIGIAALAMGFCAGYGCFVYKKSQKEIKFNERKGTIVCYPENVTFKPQQPREIDVLMDFYNYQKSKNKLDHDSFVRDLYEMDKQDGTIDRVIETKIIPEYIKEQLK